MSTARQLRVTAASQCGPTRARNEDIAVLGDATVRDDAIAVAWEASSASRPLLAAVLDGLGGHQGGAEASLRVATRLARTVSRWAPDTPLASLRDGLVDALHDAHRELNDAGHRHATLAGMGTTCTGILFAAAGAMLIHVGDSRCYRRRDGLWKLLTQDHAIERITDSGRPTTSLIFALGADISSVPSDAVSDLSETIFVGDTFLLVSDGVIAAAADDDAREHAFDAPDAMQVLDRALLHGGPDNATAVRIEVLA